MTSSMSTVLLIGATSGLGEGFARRFHALGKHLIVAGRRQRPSFSIAAEPWVSSRCSPARHHGLCNSARKGRRDAQDIRHRYCVHQCWHNEEPLICWCEHANQRVSTSVRLVPSPTGQIRIAGWFAALVAWRRRLARYQLTDTRQGHYRWVQHEPHRTYRLSETGGSVPGRKGESLQT